MQMTRLGPGGEVENVSVVESEESGTDDALLNFPIGFLVAVTIIWYG